MTMVVSMENNVHCFCCCCRGMMKIRRFVPSSLFIDCFCHLLLLVSGSVSTVGTKKSTDWVLSGSKLLAAIQQHVPINNEECGKVYDVLFQRCTWSLQVEGLSLL